MGVADYMIVGGSTGWVMTSRLGEDGAAQVMLRKEGPRNPNPIYPYSWRLLQNRARAADR